MVGEYYPLPNFGPVFTICNSCFTVDTSTGKLTATSRVDLDAIPKVLSLAPQDKFPFSAGQESGRMASFSVTPDSGELTPMETYPLGNRLAWVSVTELQ